MTLKKSFSAIIIAVFLSCGPNMGTITETDSGIVGKVSYSTGSGAAHARVQLFGARDTSRKTVDSTSTDQNGNYDFKKLTPGSYNVWVESQDSLLALIDSVYVPEDSEVIANATLYKGGSVTAIVALQPGDRPTSVFVQVLGTQRFSNVNDSGWFTIKGLAQGEYTLRLVSTIPGYTPTYRSIAVASGVDDTLMDTIYMAYSGIPIVTGIQAVFDEYTGVAKISWRKLAYTEFYEYKVYREEKGVLNPQPVLIAVSADSCFIYDTLYRPQVPDSIFDAFDTTLDANVNYRYRVTVVNKSMDEGEKYEFADVAGKDPAGLVTTLAPLQNEKFKDSVGIKCSWGKLSTAGKYQLQVSKRADFSSVVLDTITTDTVQSFPALGMGDYFARLRAMDDSGVRGFWNITNKFATIGNLFKTAINIGCPISFIQTNDSGYAVIGTSDVSSNYCPVLSKTDKSGKEVWHWSSPNDTHIFLRSIEQLENGNYVVAGDGLSGHYSSFIAMVDNTGATVWQKTFVENDSMVLNASLITSQGTTALLLINKILPNPPFAYVEQRLLKIAANGDVLQDTLLGLRGNRVALLKIDRNNFLIVASQHFGSDNFPGEDSVQLYYMDYGYHLIDKKSFFIQGTFFNGSWQLCKNGDLLGRTSLMQVHGVSRISTDGKGLWETSGSLASILVSPTSDNGMIESYQYSFSSDSINILQKYDGNNNLVWSTKNITGRCNEIRENGDGTFTAIALYTSSYIPFLVKISNKGFFIDD